MTRARTPARPVHLGVQLATSAVAWSELRDAAIRVETLGYDSVWLPDHLMAWEGEVPRFEAWQALAGIAAATSRIRLGPLVSPVTFRHPGVLAKMASTLDHISDGRLILGLGAGGMAEEHRRYGLPLGAARERARRVEEAVRIIRSLLAAGKASFRGRNYVVRAAIAQPKPLQGRLPLLIAGTSNAVIRLAARRADLWNAISLPADFVRSVGTFRTAMSAVGRPRTAVTATVSFRLIVREDGASVRSRIQELDPAWREDSYRIQGSANETDEAFAQYVKAGADGLIVQMPAPYDFLTLEHLASRRAVLERAVRTRGDRR